MLRFSGRLKINDTCRNKTSLLNVYQFEYSYTLTYTREGVGGGALSPATRTSKSFSLLISFIVIIIIIFCKQIFIRIARPAPVSSSHVIQMVVVEAVYRLALCNSDLSICNTFGRQSCMTRVIDLNNITRPKLRIFLRINSHTCTHLVLIVRAHGDVSNSSM